MAATSFSGDNFSSAPARLGGLYEWDVHSLIELYNLFCRCESKGHFAIMQNHCWLQVDSSNSNSKGMFSLIQGKTASEKGFYQAQEIFQKFLQKYSSSVAVCCRRKGAIYYVLYRSTQQRVLNRTTSHIPAFFDGFFSGVKHALWHRLRYDITKTQSCSEVILRIFASKLDSLLNPNCKALDSYNVYSGLLQKQRVSFAYWLLNYPCKEMDSACNDIKRFASQEGFWLTTSCCFAPLPVSFANLQLNQCVYFCCMYIIKWSDESETNFLQKVPKCKIAAERKKERETQLCNHVLQKVAVALLLELASKKKEEKSSDRSTKTVKTEVTKLKDSKSK